MEGFYSPRGSVWSGWVGPVQLQTSVRLSFLFSFYSFVVSLCPHLLPSSSVLSSYFGGVCVCLGVVLICW